MGKNCFLVNIKMLLFKTEKNKNATMVHLVVWPTTRCLWSQYSCTQLRLLLCLVLSPLIKYSIIISLFSFTPLNLLVQTVYTNTCILPWCKVRLKRTQCPRVADRRAFYHKTNQRCNNREEKILLQLQNFYNVSLVIIFYHGGTDRRYLGQSQHFDVSSQ